MTDEDEFELDWSRARLVKPDMSASAQSKPDQMSDEARYLIRKYSGYYRPNSQGYTGSAIQAGRYTLAEAESITHPNGPDGPRDGMSYVHEDDVKDEDWTAYRTLRAALTAAEGERDQLQLACRIQKRRAEAAEAQIAERDAELATVLAREADTIRRHDTKLDAMEVDRDAALERVKAEARGDVAGLVVALQRARGFIHGTGDRSGPVLRQIDAALAAWEGGP
jgi:hypothetical protein